jgi:ribosomal protein S12 methylthiotransferase
MAKMAKNKPPRAAPKVAPKVAPKIAPKVAIVSLGCPKNLVDSEKLLAHLAEGGCVVGAPMDAADVVIINTCGFIAPAVAESLDVIAEARRLKAAGKIRRIVVAGCLVNRQGEGLFDRAAGIDAIVGVNDRDSILSAVLGDGRVARISGSPARPASDAGRFRLTPAHTAYLRIAEGCSRRCTFCTIPSIRGRFRSKAPAAVLAEARELLAGGAVELNVIAQDTTSYGRDLGDGQTLAKLLRKLDSLDGVEWIRLLYAYPMGFDDDLIETIASCEHVVPYVDIPLQHIADGVLKRMGRHVTRRHIEQLLVKLRRRVEGLVLRTTFITGFPGETRGEFEELMSFVRDFDFEAVGVFPYYPEPGTPAARLPGRPSRATAERRRQKLMLTQQDIVFAANEAHVGKRLRVLVDGKEPGGASIGRHHGQAPDIDSVCILTSPAEPGRFVEAAIVEADGYDLVVTPI